MEKTRAEAVSEFYQGRYHPRCPVDGHTELWCIPELQRDAEGCWLAYKCKRCNTHFRATVMEKEPENAHS